MSSRIFGFLDIQNHTSAFMIKEVNCHNFQLKLQQWGICNALATSKNPSANAMCERMHHTVGNILQTRFNNNNNNNMAPNIQTTTQAVDYALTACNHAMRCSVSQSLKNNTPGEVVFAHDMFLNIPVIVNLLSIQEKRQALSIEGNSETADRTGPRYLNSRSSFGWVQN
ncbi:unnamed protein product [Cylindrotheca closterium]|uniref:Integrase catalytic domain-containing protein n=1 Tax=Cylindrotheca closterium TaxID=2856 RepID=A0AAD2JM89_9STRA|nr:unnamed protein product [Cylindrotheca closterium]